MKKLEVKNLQISFRTYGGILKAVRDISFDLYKGEVLAIVGESGSGKSVTSKAIIGILAGNAIIEGGEILYDGQDLLKISEDDFHKIRGDKIAMIFQDPLSSLNPIMRIGRQLTEAMLLKAKGSRKNARRNFNHKLSILEKNCIEALNETDIVTKEEIKSNISTFKKICLYSTKLERDYNEAHSKLVGLQFTVENTLFLISKKQKIDYKKILKTIKKEIEGSLHPFVLVKNNELEQLINEIDQLKMIGRKVNLDKIVETLNKLAKVITTTLEKVKPDFFSLGYFVMQNPQYDIYSMSVEDLSKMTIEFFEKNFLNEFYKIAELGMDNAHKKSIALKKEVVKVGHEFLDLLKQENRDKGEISKKAKELSILVKLAINRLVTRKNSTEYTFASSIKSFIKTYYDGIHNNPKQQKRYNREEKKYNKLIAAGKKPDWKLVPPRLVDLDVAFQNIVKVVTNLVNTEENDLNTAKDFNKHEEVLLLIDYLKEEASKIVSKLTPKMAKAKAIKLMEEVGIPEPHIRYHQYPFEFSGGMRQRIVIAIALSANPDILICDEPTTALDVTIQAQILELIKKLKDERDLSVIFITHNLGVVANMADRVAVMYAGKIVEIGTADEVFYDPRHPYTWALLGSMPDLETKERLESIPGTPPNMIYPPKGDAFAERNKYALEIDYELQPPLFEITETHYAATWLLHPNAPKVELPEVIQKRIQRIKDRMSKDEK
ncbi:MAG TPA: oligopeptide/dipeptide ABC transporter ATP-binding protein [Haloplasmataceae bacterium]